MTLDSLTIFAFVGIAIATARYVLYFRDIFWRGVRPHVFSWFIWAVLTTVVTVAQFVAGGGPGAWITGYVTIMCFAISVVALFKGTKDITRSDWVCLIAALFAIGVWWVTDTPLLALLIAMSADLLGYIPTYRKSINNPDEESALGFGIASLRSVFGILALASWNITTLIYPIFLLLADGGVAVLVWYRRRQLQEIKSQIPAVH